MNRSDVYKLIDGERTYQDKLPSTRTDGRDHTVGEYLVMLKYYTDIAFREWTLNAGDEASLDVVRKIAGIAVHCMEDHETKARE